MIKNSLDQFIEDIRKIWGPLDSEVVTKAQALMEALTKSPVSEAWLQELRQGFDGSRELYRDPVHGFILLAYVEKKDLYRPPHDHGAGWVIYSVQEGEMEMRTFARIQDENGNSKVTSRDKYPVRAGETRVYLPGDIHDTKCISDSALIFRLTSLDLKEEQRLGRMHRYQI